MKSIFKNRVWLVLTLLFCLSPVFAETTPTSDFVDNGDGTVTHIKTKLTWMRCFMGQTWDGTTCLGSVSYYNGDEAVVLKSDFAGKKDWRLPTVDELLSTVNEGNQKPAIINSSIFPNTPSETYYGWAWAYSVNDEGGVTPFYYGSDYSNIKGDGGVVRLVRVTR